MSKEGKIVRFERYEKLRMKATDTPDLCFPVKDAKYDKEGFFLKTEGVRHVVTNMGVLPGTQDYEQSTCGMCGQPLEGKTPCEADDDQLVRDLLQVQHYQSVQHMVRDLKVKYRFVLREGT